LGRIFQHFVLLKSGLALYYGGSGLGLALVQQMVHLHGGKVSVESKVNGGSRFTVILPWQAEKTPEKSVLLPASQDLPQRDSGGVVLIVEDTEVVAQLISDYLRHKGYRTFIASNGREGVLLARQKRPQIILMDVMMPIMNGLDAARAIRDDPSLQEIPIIGLTALAMPSDREECLKAGMNDHIPKPVQMQELLKVIERYLRPSD
jgi:CheY-like chemotaxis protein